MSNLSLLVKRKTWNARPATLGGKPATEFHGKFINQLDSGLNWSSINCELTQVLNGFEMEGAPFYFNAPKRSNGYAEMVNNNRFDIFRKNQITCSEFSMIMRGSGVDDVPGQLFDINGVGRSDAVLYPNAYNSSFLADLVYFVDHGRAPRLRKLIKFDKAPTNDVIVSFEIEFSGKTELSPRKLNIGEVRAEERDRWYTNLHNSEKLYLNSDVKRNEGLYVRAWNEPQKRGMGFREPIIWDSGVGEDKKIARVEAYIEWVSIYSYTLTKIIPKSFFTDAVYPVYCDTTSTFYPDPHPESTSFDGFIRAPNLANQTWAAIHNHSGAGGVTDDTSVSNTCVQIRGDTTSNRWFWLTRAPFLFDTSSLPDGDLVSDATFSIHGSAKSDPGGTKVSVNVVDCNPSSDTGITDTDYSTLGSNGFSTKIAYDSFNVAGYNDFILNGSGIANISKTGISKFATLDADYDLPDIAPAWVNDDNSLVRCYFADDPGTTRSPKLVAEHAPGGSVSALFNAGLMVRERLLQ